MRRIVLGLALALAACDEGSPLDVARPIFQIQAGPVDFGPVPEGTSATKSAAATNPASVPLSLSLAFADGSSPDFALSATQVEANATATAILAITFTPSGAGSDEATLIVTSDDPQNPRVEVRVTGGPIAPALAVSPDPVDFGPASTAIVTRPVALSNAGDADLHVTEVVIDPAGNTDFALRAVTIPPALAPGAELEVVVDYTRGADASAGRLIVRSDDPTTPEREIRLLPDPLRACQDQLDNDGDNLTDFPDDPGCTSATDNDESNPPECEDGTTMTCGTTAGTCRLGMRTCTNRLWGPCEGGVEPVAEICDNLDNDCNGRTDEGISETCTVHGCAGARACVESSSTAGGLWTACIAINPAAETCDGTDEDCDGVIDNGIVEACTENGCTGTRICVPGGTGQFTSCNVQRATEICNGADDDCDGTPDNGIADLTCGTGECRQTVSACMNGGPNTCVPGTGSTEVCNNLDDNCDGTPDNLPNLTCGLGVCQRTVPACAGGAPNTCVPGTGSTEVCNNLDDNCDGTPDNPPNLTCGLGVCQRSVPACAGGAPNTCVPGTGSTEVCNNLDDDCDGTPDDLPNLTCGLGVCQRSVPACAGGAPNTCVPGTGSAETCNGLDDDCDGTPDDGGVCGGACGLMSTAADPQEPNNASGTPNPVIPWTGNGTFVYEYDLTLPPTDTDWIEFGFPGIGQASFAEITAEITCVSWAGAGCGAAPTVGLAAWYIDACFPQQDDIDNGTAGLALVTSSGPVSSLGFCNPQRFRIRAFPSTTVCAGEAANAHLRITTTWSP